MEIGIFLEIIQKGSNPPCSAQGECAAARAEPLAAAVSAGLRGLRGLRGARHGQSSGATGALGLLPIAGWYEDIALVNTLRTGHSPFLSKSTKSSGHFFQ